MLHSIETYSERLTVQPLRPAPGSWEGTALMALVKRKSVRFRSGSSLPPGWILATDERGLHLGRFVLHPPKAEFEVGRTIMTYTGDSKRQGRVRPSEEDLFSEADVDCVMDHRENTVVLVHPKQMDVLSVAGGRIQPVSVLANLLGQPSRVRIHR